jgi:5'-methylthioinosine phosphorylase
MSVDLAVVGGSGLYQFPGLSEVETDVQPTPFGAPSAPIAIGRLGPHRLAFLARHGTDHRLAPHRVNYRANLWALHALGARRVVGINAVGGIRADLAPRTLVVPDQIIDYTHGRPSSFSDVEQARVEHIDFSEPYSVSLRRALLGAAARVGVTVIDGGCYGVTQGPRLETKAEIARLRQDGCDLVGMTGMPEAVLARELGIEYACLAVVANWAAGCAGEEIISLEAIYANLAAAMANVPSILRAMLDSPIPAAG